MPNERLEGLMADPIDSDYHGNLEDSTNLPIPEALYPCASCKEDYSYPATDLFWNDRMRDWVCSNCWDYDVNEKRGVSMEDEIKRHSVGTWKSIP